MAKKPVPAADSSAPQFQPGDKVRALYGDFGVGEVADVKVDPKRAHVHRVRVKVRFDRHDDDTKLKDLPEFSVGALASA